jgi:hypothetical protein
MRSGAEEAGRAGCEPGVDREDDQLGEPQRDQGGDQQVAVDAERTAAPPAAARGNTTATVTTTTSVQRRNFLISGKPPRLRGVT